MHELAQRARLKQLAHYVIARTGGRPLGKTRLNKALWISDIWSLRRFGRTITGAEVYQRQQFGPVPFDILKALAELKAEGVLVETHRETFAGVRHDFVSLKEPSVEGLTAEQVDILHQVIEFVCTHTAKQLSDMTHDALWEEVPMFDPIPVIAATVVEDELTPEDVAWAKSVYA